MLVTPLSSDVSDGSGFFGTPILKPSMASSIPAHSPSPTLPPLEHKPSLPKLVLSHAASDPVSVAPQPRVAALASDNKTSSKLSRPAAISLGDSDDDSEVVARGRSFSVGTCTPTMSPPKKLSPMKSLAIDESDAVTSPEDYSASPIICVDPAVAAITSTRPLRPRFSAPLSALEESQCVDVHVKHALRVLYAVGEAHKGTTRCFVWRQVVHQLTSDPLRCFATQALPEVIRIVRVIRKKRLFQDDVQPRDMQYVSSPSRGVEHWPCVCPCVMVLA
jgi:hypothetical protein